MGRVFKLAPYFCRCCIAKMLEFNRVLRGLTMPGKFKSVVRSGEPARPLTDRDGDANRSGRGEKREEDAA